MLVDIIYKIAKMPDKFIRRSRKGMFIRYSYVDFLDFYFKKFTLIFGHPKTGISHNILMFMVESIISLQMNSKLFSFKCIVKIWTRCLIKY